MFRDAIAFNQPLNNWNVGNVVNMTCMFSGAHSFNQPLNNWNVGKVINTNRMFLGADSFDQDISEWDVRNVNEITKVLGDNIDPRTYFVGLTDPTIFGPSIKNAN